MGKYNIYRIVKPKEPSLIEKLKSVGLSDVGRRELESFNLTFFVSKEPEDIDIWWVDLYKDYLENLNKKLKNKAYFGIFLLSNENLCYAISMGKSHFYLKDYCDTDFGINLAERIADRNHWKLKNSKLFGGKRSKIITCYQENSEFEHDSGESIHYIKAKTIDKERWGSIASFGNSVQLHLEIKPDGLPKLVNQVEEELRKEPKITLPRATAISDDDKIKVLDQKLVQAIQDKTSTTLQAAEATVSGVDFIFLDKNNYRFLMKGKKSQNIEGELNIQALQDYIQQNGIDLLMSLNDIRIKVFNENEKGYTKPIKYFIDYVDDERHFLLDGKWHIFNQNYINYLKDQVDNRITFDNKSNTNLSISGFEQWKNSLSEKEKKSLGYREYYFNSLRESDGYINLDRQLSTIQSDYKIEKMDLWKEDTLLFVKIGTPQKLSYVIDQSMATIKLLQNQNIPIKLNELSIRPRRVCLWLILERQSKISKISEIKSLIFLMKLAEWQRQSVNAGYEPIVRIGYIED